MSRTGFPVPIDQGCYACACCITPFGVFRGLQEGMGGAAIMTCCSVRELCDSWYQIERNSCCAARCPTADCGTSSFSAEHILPCRHTLVHPANRLVLLHFPIHLPVKSVQPRAGFQSFDTTIRTSLLKLADQRHAFNELHVNVEWNGGHRAAPYNADRSQQ